MKFKLKSDKYNKTHPHLEEAIKLLSSLISVPSFSREENMTADIWENWLRHADCKPVRFHNNIYTLSKEFTPGKPILLLNSHHDTVKPSSSYTKDPFKPEIVDDKLFGLGSNDAGAAGVTLAMTFLELKDRKDLPVNLIFSITAAEEVMGELGMRAFLPHLKEKGLYPDMAIVGEPTDMQPAIAERGLLVFDAVTKGVSGHAARDEGINALYRAIEDINILRNFQPEKKSEILGDIRISITMMECGTQHNVVPDICKYVVDVRTTDAYSNIETVELLKKAVKYSELTPRSTRVHSSVINRKHPLVSSAERFGLIPFVSLTTSDMALMHDIPSLKIGPGLSERSHSADEFVRISEINEALHIYPEIILGI